MQILAPYLVFIGDATDALSIKMARGVADWRPELCIGEAKVDGCTVTTGLPQKTIEQAHKEGAKSLVLGFANSGGVLDVKWHPYIIEALSLGMDVVSGLHDKLNDVPALVEIAKAHNCQMHDIRHPTAEFKTGTGAKGQYH